MNRLRYLLTRHLRRNADMRRRREARAERAMFDGFTELSRDELRQLCAPLWMAHKPALPELCYPVSKN